MTLFICLTFTRIYYDKTASARKRKIFVISLSTPIAHVLNRARFLGKGYYVTTETHKKSV